MPCLAKSACISNAFPKLSVVSKSTLAVNGSEPTTLALLSPPPPLLAAKIAPTITSTIISATPPIIPYNKGLFSKILLKSI